MRTFVSGVALACALLVALQGGVMAATPARKKTVSRPRASGRAALPIRSADPYLGAIVIDAATGEVLFEQNADAQGFPASVIKLMDMMVLLDGLSAGQWSPSNTVTVTAQAAKVGGSQVYLAEKETFPLEDLMYALMIQSANDAAMAMALHVAGSAEGFVALMNKKAAELGMTQTRFHSVHGLPPASGQQGDASTARDLAALSKALIERHPEILAFTSVRERPFRGGQFIMRSHNRLLGSFPGCDGLKTGYITAGGFSIVVTAGKAGRRVIAVVLGSKDRKVRDAKAAELLAKGLAELASRPAPPPVVAPAPVTTNRPAAPLPEAEPITEDTAASGSGWLLPAGLGLVGGLVVAGVVAFLMRRRDDSLV
jgi:D-alanyl-D-alanine carboxypeptidase (penicillin-binding protein 5/6)